MANIGKPKNLLETIVGTRVMSIMRTKKLTTLCHLGMKPGAAACYLLHTSFLRKPHTLNMELSCSTEALVDFQWTYTTL
jgi:hypothetical protein